MSVDVIVNYKAAQRAGWAHFAPLQALTTEPAGRLVRFADIRPGNRVLDVACGTGVVAVTAARRGAVVSGLDLTPQLLDVARDKRRLRASVSTGRRATPRACRFPTTVSTSSSASSATCSRRGRT